MDENVKKVYISILRDDVNPHKSFKLWNSFKRVVLLDDTNSEYIKTTMYPEHIRIMMRYRVK